MNQWMKSAKLFGNYNNLITKRLWKKFPLNQNMESNMHNKI